MAGHVCAKNHNLSRVMRKPDFCLCENKAVTAQLISAFIIATQIVQFIYLLIPKFQASSHLMWFYSPVCVEPGRKTPKTGFLTSRLIT